MKMKGIRQKAWKVFGAAAVAAMLTACAGASDPGTPAPSPDVTEHMTDGPGSEQTPEQSAGDPAQPDQTQQEPQQETAPADGRVYTLRMGYDADTVYQMDSTGKVIAQIDLRQATDVLADQGIYLNEMAWQGVQDGILYYSSYEDVGGRYAYKIYAVDPQAGKVQVLYTTEQDWWLDCVDLYNGQVYLTLSGNDYAKKELVCTKNPGALTYTIGNVQLDRVLKSASGYYLQNYDPSFGSYTSCSLTKTLDRAGFVVGTSNGRYVTFDRDGNRTELFALEDSTPSIRGYDGKFLIASDYADDDWSSQLLFAYSFESGDLRQIKVPGYDLTYLAYEDGLCYVCGERSKDYGITTHTVYCYDCAAAELHAVYEMTTVPGSHTEPGTQSFQLVGGQPCFAGVAGDELHWMIVKETGGSAQITDTGCRISELSALKLGHVEYLSKTSDCPFCGIRLEETYEEYFVLDGSLSAHADQINDALYAYAIASFGDTDPWIPETDEDCEDHQEYAYAWCTTTDNNVYGAEILEDRYLTVGMSGYCYAGGAHGYPSRRQYLFDLETGREVTLADLYPGTEEDFKTLIAQKTQEDYRRYEWEYSPYYAEDEEMVYADAYEQAGLNLTQAEFTEDGVVIIYPPYNMGPYASGYIEFLIPYEEILGRPTLTQN